MDDKMNAVIDIGNSRFKVGFFDNNQMVKKEIFLTIEELIQTLSKKNIHHVLIASVRNESFEKPIQSVVSGTCKIFTVDTKIPIQNLYESKSIGVDRLASVVGAMVLFSEVDCLTIDLGTCLTHNLLLKNHAFVGGGISLGYKMRLDAVAHFTQQLPHLKVGAIEAFLPGKNTHDSIALGVYWGMVDEINGLIERYLEEYPNLQVIITGGDAAFFEKRLKQAIFVSYDLNLIGLNRILQYNVE